MTKSKLGRNPLSAKAPPRKASAAASAAKSPDAPDAHVQAGAASSPERESSVPGFIGNLAAAVVAETVLLGLRTFLYARNNLSRRG